ncbi:O(6)-methylguanine-induced apoptosis 2 isoform X2 [Macrotis lagotis]|uniref:O(6)-methylguanine-induced apoptosis 2 isoform X2 n=1 Tax=Macrotis lagotis TaxID=92651 RepID=UPI003D68C316
METEDFKKCRNFKDIQKGYTGAYPKQSSIPSKFRTIVIPDSERKGFNSQSKRFYSKLDENPGPGFYNVIHQSPEFNSVSISRKGTGTFPSVENRLYRKTPNYPAANAYNLQSSLLSKKDFSTTCSHMFQLPFCEKIYKWPTPAPNHYHPKPFLSKDQIYLCAPQAGFLSTTPRRYPPTKERVVPSPGHYEINETLVKATPKLLGCVFKSKVARDVKIKSFVPGPGTYNLNEPIKSCQKKSIFPKKYALTFSAFPLPPLPKPSIPGPGQYDIVNYEGPSKHYISSATFVSNTCRWSVNANQIGLPGPGLRL